MSTVEDYRSDVENQWCPGCPDFGILMALKRALVSLGRAPHEVCLVSGIGQAAKLPHYMRCHVFNGLHGRAIPTATGIHVAHPDLTTIVTSGDGCLYGEGGSHLLNVFRRNPNITVIVHDNRIYALTKGQASPTTRRGEKTRLQFDGVEVDPAQMMATAIVHDCGFVARGFAGDIDGLSEIFASAIEHRGLSLVDVIQPCVTWGRRPLEWYGEHVVPIPSDYDPSNRERAIAWAIDEDKALAVGVLYRRPPRETFASSYRDRVGRRPLAELGPIDRTVIEAQLAAFTSRRE